jgi:D-alanyl-D-alanine carboxypeptidase/D-alanyl-D-alanine-endopeptidase (penicillin-binding protein 4)
VGTPALLATPILSVRRAPDWIEDSVADERLAAGLPALLAPLGAASATSCLLVTQGHRVIFASHPLEELVPASNMKLLLATAVVDELGATARLTTRVTATHRPVGGTLHGNLYLVGGGDPLLWTPAYDATERPVEPLYTPLPALAARVRAAGITAVTGGVIGDESRFDSVRGVAGWKPSYEADGNVGPLSALELNNGFDLSPHLGPAREPAVMAASVFSQLLRNDGVTVRGAAASGVSPSSAVAVTSIASAPLGQVVGAILRVSDDTGAELLTKQLGRQVAGTGSTAAGVAAIRADLAADGLPAGQLRAGDGSGLDGHDRVTCQLLVDDLHRIGTTGAIFAGLPVAGRTGTLSGRMLATAATGRLHAKTGSLDGVSALSGFVLPPSRALPTASLGVPITFSFIANNVAGPSVGEGVADAIGVDLAGLAQSSPPLSDALPLTSRPPAAGR